MALIEKQSFPRRKVCGECVAASNLPLLDALGIGGGFADKAGPELKRVALMRGAQSVWADLPAAADARQPWGRAIGRETLIVGDSAGAISAHFAVPDEVSGYETVRVRDTVWVFNEGSPDAERFRIDGTLPATAWHPRHANSSSRFVFVSSGATQFREACASSLAAATSARVAERTTSNRS